MFVNSTKWEETWSLTRNPSVRLLNLPLRTFGSRDQDFQGSTLLDKPDGVSTKSLYFVRELCERPPL